MPGPILRDFDLMVLGAWLGKKKNSWKLQVSLAYSQDWKPLTSSLITLQGRYMRWRFLVSLSLLSAQFHPMPKGESCSSYRLQEVTLELHLLIRKGTGNFKKLVFSREVSYLPPWLPIQLTGQLSHPSATAMTNGQLGITIYLNIHMVFNITESKKPKCW